MEEKKYYKIKKLLKLKYIIIAIVIIMFIGTNIISIEDTVSMRIVVTALGIDVEDGNYHSSAQIFTPSTDKSKFQPKQVINGEGRSVNDAIENMISKTGRFGNISHCKIIILGKSVLEYDAAIALNHFVNNKALSWSTIVAATDGSAKTVIEGLNTLEKDLDFAWQNYVEPDRQNGDTVATDLRMFLDTAASPSKCVLTNILNIKKAETQSGQGGSSGGNEGMGNQGGGQGEGGSETEAPLETLVLENIDSVVIKDGKKVCKLNKDETRGYNLLKKRNKIQTQFIDVAEYIEAEKLNQDDLAAGRYKLSLKMERKDVKLKFKYIDGVPTVSIKIKAVYEKYEDESDGFKFLSVEERADLRQKGVEALKIMLRRQFDEAFKISKDYDADFFQFTARFKQANLKEFNRFMSGHTSKEFLESINFDFNMQINLEI